MLILTKVGVNGALLYVAYRPQACSLAATVVISSVDSLYDGVAEIARGLNTFCGAKIADNY